MAEVIHLIKFKERKESLPKFTLEYQKAQLLEYLGNRSKVGYTNVGFALLQLAAKDFRFRRGSSFTEAMIDRLLFELAIDEKIQLRTKDGVSQLRLYSKKPCFVYEILNARERANNIWGM
jgi:hypothetical protein